MWPSAAAAASRSGGVPSTSSRCCSSSNSSSSARPPRPSAAPAALPRRGAARRPTAAAAPAAAPAAPASAAAQEAKQELLRWLGGTRRGASTTKQLRGQIEEAQLAVEACSPAELDYALLEGKWRLVYTTAADVLPIVGLDLQLPGGLPAPVSVGGVFQRFSSVERGLVQNIIEFSVPLLVEQDRGITFTVGASYEVRSGRRIALTFEEAEVGQLRISPSLEALLAPALLPRGTLNQQILLALKEFKLVFPFRSAQQVVQGRGVGANYLLTYLDGDMLIGRASGTAGTFIFTRDADGGEGQGC